MTTAKKLQDGPQHDRFGGKKGGRYGLLRELDEADFAAEAPPADDAVNGYQHFINCERNPTMLWVVQLGDGLTEAIVKVGRWVMIEKGTGIATWIVDSTLTITADTLIEQPTYADYCGVFITSKTGTATTPTRIAYKKIGG